MRSFLSQVAKHLVQNHPQLDGLVLVLPSNRAATFLSNALSKAISQPMLLPRLLSIETFITELSALQPTTPHELPIHLYDAYLSLNPEPAANYLEFLSWGQTLLNDFDEIDRYLTRHNQLFDYLTAADEIKSWYLKPKNQTPLVQQHFNFLRELKGLYHTLEQKLDKDNLGYQGKRYRQAVANLPTYLEDNPRLHYGFIGFNAFNTAEETIVKKLLEAGTITLYWDLDPYFKPDGIHDANYFIKNHTKKWDTATAAHWFSADDSYLSEKNIQITGVPKNSSQANYVGSLLHQLSEEIAAAPVALVLSDESLLPLVLHAIPKTVENINVTMGYPLGNTESFQLIHQLLALCSRSSRLAFTRQEMQTLFSNPFFQSYVNQRNASGSAYILNRIQQQNYSSLTRQQLADLLPNSLEALRLFIVEQIPKTASFIGLLKNLITHLGPKFKADGNTLEVQALQTITTILDTFQDITEKKNYLQLLANSEPLFHALCKNKSLDLKGNPFKGLQIMGMLETRCLDFETVIIMSINEGILPAGKTQNSFIPLDAKIEFGLPTYKEKDAVYTYHFYRLLQRARQIFITYNTETDVLEGGEKSRLIAQLLTDENINPYITHTISSPDIPISPTSTVQVQKTEGLITALTELCENGLSPTSLSTYIEDPYAFYKRYILNIDEPQPVTNTIAPNLFGTIIHDTLEELYAPFLNKRLTADQLKKTKEDVNRVVQQQFAKTYSDSSIDHGQNLIVYQVLVRYIQNQLDYEIQQCQKHDIVLLGLEQKLEAFLKVTGLDKTIKIKGKLDRVDRYDGHIRILDYKTGNVVSSNVLISSFEEVVTQKQKNKAFQLLCYALMYSKTIGNQPLLAGIIPIKNMGNGILQFGLKTSGKPSNRNPIIDQHVLDQFEEALIGLIRGMFNSTENLIASADT